MITVCNDAQEKCPYISSEARKIHKSFPDPARAIGNKDEIRLTYMKVRDMLKEFCKDFVEDELGIRGNERKT